MDGIKTMKQLLERMLENCHCDTLEQCGKGISKRGSTADPVGLLPVKGRYGQTQTH
jgi:hypothetical protein